GRGGDRDQRGGAGAVDGVATAAEVEVVADAAGDGVGEPAGEGVLVDGRERRLVHRLEVAQEGAGLVVVPTLGGQRGGDGAPHVGPAQPHQVGARELSGQAVAEHHAGGLTGQAV